MNRSVMNVIQQIPYLFHQIPYLLSHYTNPELLKMIAAVRFSTPITVRFQNGLFIGNPNGKAIFIDSMGDSFEGQFQFFSMRKGQQGKLIKENGDTITGRFDDTKKGVGHIEYENGKLYDGPFENGLPNGKGVLVLRNGTRIEGVFTDGIASGFGTITYPNDIRYEGPISNNKANGNGLQFYPTLVMEGRFTDGELNGHGILYDDNDSFTYEGEFMNSVKHGFGIKKTSTYTQKGNYEHGKKEGVFTKVYVDGTVEQHVYHNGKLQDGDAEKQGRRRYSKKTKKHGIRHSKNKK
jgi:hypothetical protein